VAGEDCKEEPGLEVEKMFKAGWGGNSRQMGGTQEPEEDIGTVCGWPREKA